MYIPEHFTGRYKLKLHMRMETLKSHPGNILELRDFKKYVDFLILLGKYENGLIHSFKKQDLYINLTKLSISLMFLCQI